MYQFSLQKVKVNAQQLKMAEQDPTSSGAYCKLNHLATVRPNLLSTLATLVSCHTAAYHVSTQH